MTAPDDRVRGFPVFPASRRRGARGRTWWANAWIDALEDTSLDAEPLRRGRRIATAGRVGPITVSPGRIAAPVYDADGAPRRTAVHVDRLDDTQWDRFYDQVAAHAGHLAALLDHDMPRALADATADADVRLLPGIGDLEPECDCDGWELPCEHAAALCYQTGWLLDEDPFVLLLLRGRGEHELLTELQRRNTDLATRQTPTRPSPGPYTGDLPDTPGAAAGLHPGVLLPSRPGPGQATQDTAAHSVSGPEGIASGAAPRSATDGAGADGVPARLAYAEQTAGPPSLDDPPTGPVAPAFTPSPAPGIDPAALVRLATDAAIRARTLLTRDDTGPAHARTTEPRPASGAASNRLTDARTGVRPADTRASGPADARPAAVRPAATRPGDTEAIGARPRGARSIEMWPGDVWTDTVRLAAVHPRDARLRANLDRACGDPGRLERAVVAWRLAGGDGLATLETPWTPRAATPGWRTGRARAADALARAQADGTWAAADQAEAEVWRNHWIPPAPRPGAEVQLRFGRDGRWYPYRRRDGAWWPAGPPHADAADALAAFTAPPG